jgi:1,4-dihydroxy-2-naphthoate octaprenyltransferase
MASTNKWILGARPKTLPAVIAPTLVGNALGVFQLHPHHFNLINALLTLTVGLAMQIGVNYSNDYSDGIKGTDADRVGPVRLTASGLASPAAVKRAAILTYLLGAIAGLIFSLRTTPWFIAIGVVAIVAAWGYTGGKNPYGYRGLGELSVFLFFGLVATVGSFYGQYKSVTAASLYEAIAMGCLGCSILIVNNLRDIEGDSKVNKRTLAVRLGDQKTRTLLIIVMALPYALTLVMVTQSAWFAIPLATIPLYVKVVKEITAGAQAKALIVLLGKIGKLQMFYALLTLLAMALASLI